MMMAVKGYFNGENIVTDEKISLQTGQKVIITILENPVAAALQKFQSKMKDEVKKNGFDSEDDIANWITESRKISSVIPFEENCFN